MNALSLAKLGIGFGALAVASIGLLSSEQIDSVQINMRIQRVQTIEAKRPYRARGISTGQHDLAARLGWKNPRP
jgi:hypothetical protein